MMVKEWLGDVRYGVRLEISSTLLEDLSYMDDGYG